MCIILIILIWGTPCEVECVPLSKNDINIFIDLTTTSIKSSSKKGNLEKWDDGMRIRVFGTPKTGDWLELDKVINDINTVVGRNVVISDQQKPNMLIFFMEPEAFKEKFKIRQIPTWAYMFYTRYDTKKKEYVILYVSDDLIGDNRKAAIRGGVTRALGFTGASKVMKYTSLNERLSVYSPEYSELEQRLIRLICHDTLKEGMTRKELKELLPALGDI